MGKSYGFIEITGVVAAINALDIMCKTADVELASWERKLGGRLVTLIVPVSYTHLGWERPDSSSNVRIPSGSLHCIQRNTV